MAPTVRGIGFYKDFPIIFLLKLFRKKIVFHLHNKGILRHQDKWFDDKLYRFAFCDTKLILLSERLYDDVKRYADRKNVFICPNGILGQAIQKHYRSDTTASLLFLSNMMVAKGVYTLLDACTILKGKAIKYRCDFVGKWTDITEKDFQAAIKERNLNDCVFAHGAKYGNEKAYFFEQTDIFIFPTFHETFGLVNLEAMKYGLPVVGTDEGGIPDIIDDGITGYIVEKQNPEELANRIETLIANPSLREKMGKAGQKKFQRQFTFDIFERQLFNILNYIQK
jgi:glycosyltransferase involved in cell wall biosynthesis